MECHKVYRYFSLRILGVNMLRVGKTVFFLQISRSAVYLERIAVAVMVHACLLMFRFPGRSHFHSSLHLIEYLHPGIPTTIKTMGVNITTIVYLRVLIIQIGSTIFLMVVEA